jgi:hypothetical protein
MELAQTRIRDFFHRPDPNQPNQIFDEMMDIRRRRSRNQNGQCSLPFTSAKTQPIARKDPIQKGSQFFSPPPFSPLFPVIKKKTKRCSLK